MKSRSSIYDVAEAAGVSITTVSHALNGKGRISPGTRRRVQRIAAEFDYYPHAGARSLAGTRTGVLGFAVSQAPGFSFTLTDFAYFMQMMGAATKRALEREYALVLVPVLPGSSDPFRRFEVDGAIIVDPVIGDPLVRRLTEAGIPVVTTGRVLDDENGYWIDNDHVSGARSMLRHLERAGARRTALLTGPPAASYTFDCTLAYEAWCGEQGREPQVIIPRGVLSEDGGFEAAGELLDGEDPPDAIYATLDRMAIGALRAGLVRGLKVPQDLLIGSHTDGESVRWAQPSITALALHPDEIGAAAMDMLTTLIDGGEPELRHVTIASQLLIRGSTTRTGTAAPDPVPVSSTGAGAA